MLRIHFTPEDIGKVRVASRPDPIWETIFSIFRLRYAGPELVYGPWRAAARRVMRRADLEILLPLIPGGYYPDFLTPFEATEGLEAGLEAIMRTPKKRLRSELSMLATQKRRIPTWVNGLAEGDVATLGRVAGALRSHHSLVVDPIWPEIRANIEADRSKRARAFLTGGCEGLLSSFQPLMTWDPPILTIDPYRYERDFYLDGRGLLLLPAFLSWHTPDMLRDPLLPPVITYPVEHDPLLSCRAKQASESVVALIGSTRAAVLESVGRAAPRPSWPAGWA